MIPPRTEPWITELSTFSDGFREKGRQVTPAITAFRMRLSSRYGKAAEMREMLWFAELAADAGVAGYIQEVFYDSKVGLCSFTLAEKAAQQPRVLAAIHACARQSLRQFISPVDDGWYSLDEKDEEDDGP
jgi:hypothetical protein